MVHRTTRVVGWSAARALSLAVLASAWLGLPVRAQAVTGGTETIDFDRPEAWAQKYFTSLTMLTGFGAPRYVDRGFVGLGLEAGWVPHLSEEQRTVGFSGTKEEDLNKTSVIGRLGVTVGIPWRLSLTVDYTPPIELNGATPNLLGLALGRPVFDAGVARFGVRLHGQTGTIEGDFTCSADVVAAGDDPLRNPFGCEAPSSDEFRTRYAGLEISAAFPLRAGKIEPFLTASSNYVDTDFQVNARYSNIIDRRKLETDGWTWYVTGGSDFALSKNWKLAVELFFSPLDVLRPGYIEAETDGLFNARVLVRWNVH